MCRVDRVQVRSVCACVVEIAEKRSGHTVAALAVAFYFNPRSSLSSDRRRRLRPLLEVRGRSPRSRPPEERPQPQRSPPESLFLSHQQLLLVLLLLHPCAELRVRAELVCVRLGKSRATVCVRTCGHLCSNNNKA